MCYSAMVQGRWREFLRATGMHLDVREFYELFVRREAEGASAVRIPRGVEHEFADPKTEQEQGIHELVLKHRQLQTAKLETEVFAQRKRLAEAERKLAVKPTKAATESARIAQSKTQKGLERLALLRDDEPDEGDYRIFPFTYTPIIVHREGHLVMIPARYHLRQPGQPVSIDRKYPGLYNARRDNLTKFWRQEFGVSHAILPVTEFFENVEREGVNHVLNFKPQPTGLMWVATLYAQWKDPVSGQLLTGCAAITDEPPPEVAAAGHDRMIISLNPETIEQWLTPQGRSVDALQALLDDRQRPYYEHQVLAA